MRASDHHFDLARGHSERHAQFSPRRQAFADGVGDVRFRFGFSSSLAHAARDGRTFGDIHAIFIGVDVDSELHSAFYSSGRAAERGAPVVSGRLSPRSGFTDPC